MDERQKQEFGWALREAGLTFPFVQFDAICRVVADFAEAEYERGFDEGCDEINRQTLEEDEL